MFLRKGFSPTYEQAPIYGSRFPLLVREEHSPSQGGQTPTAANVSHLNTADVSSRPSSSLMEAVSVNHPRLPLLFFIVVWLPFFRGNPIEVEFPLDQRPFFRLFPKSTQTRVPFTHTLRSRLLLPLPPHCQGLNPSRLRGVPAIRPVPFY